MKKHIISMLCLPLLAFMSCTDDLSAYDPQAKEEVTVDKADDESGDNTGDEEELPDGVLVPGIHLVKINVTEPDGTVAERRFKYYMPISVDESKPISLIFEFHGSYEFDAGVTPSDPIAGISISHALIQHAIRENCVVCFPAGSVETQADGSGAVNWQYSEKHLPFFDAMVDYFRSRTPSVDMNRIYSTGQSSGSIFSFVLAFERSGVVAAISPRAGQMNIDSQTELPGRAVPVRVFAGIDDDIVNHGAVIRNMTAWAERIGGYFASDMVLMPDSIEIENYRTVDVRYWEGGNTDYQIFSLHDEGHGISLAYCLPYMWEFMSAHTLGDTAGSLFITSSIKEIEAMCGEPVEFDIKHTPGAAVTIDPPKGWDFSFDGSHVSMRAPADFFGPVSRKGEMKLTVSFGGKSRSVTIPYSLAAPKNYFEVGDVYYNEDFLPVGIVFWVNEENIREAKIVSLQEVTTQGTYKNINFGDFGTTFTTPDTADGEANTAAHMRQRADAGLESRLTAVNSGLVWAATYSYNGTDGWYLPAIDELKALGEAFNVVSEAVVAAGGDTFFTAASSSYLSSTVTPADGSKCFHMFNLSKGTESTQIRSNTSYYYARAIHKVSK